MEVLENRREYFKVLFWCFKPPTDKDLTGMPEPPSLEQHQNEYKPMFRKAINDPNVLKHLTKSLEYRQEYEEKRRATLDSKAQVMISQGGIAAALLVAAISIMTVSSTDWSINYRMGISFLIAIPIINLLAASLHARNAIVLKYAIVVHGIPLYDDPEWYINYLVEKIYIAAHNSYINNVKGTYLKLAHWLYKVTFISLGAITLLIPLAPRASKIISTVGKIINWIIEVFISMVALLKQLAD